MILYFAHTLNHKWFQIDELTYFRILDHMERTPAYWEGAGVCWAEYDVADDVRA